MHLTSIFSFFYFVQNPLDKYALTDKSCHSHAMRSMGNVGPLLPVVTAINLHTH